MEQSPQAINDYYARKMRLSWFNTAISKLIFKQVLLKRAYSKEEFMAFIAKTGFSKYEILDDPANMGFEIWLEKSLIPGQGHLPSGNRRW